MLATENNSLALSVSDFCAYYGIGKTLAYEEIATGRLRAKKVGKRTIILAADAARWAASLPDINEKP
ncbi:DNA-binding protein [Devosia sp.]|jgi:hypothetical protein|uniref:DNA-binding protein n=1 Tax=Devosia sp. TaxID=1871048 RepID=UPI0037BF43BC